MKKLTVPMLVSVVAHASLLIVLSGVVRYVFRTDRLPVPGRGGGNGSVFVEIVGDDGSGGEEKRQAAPTKAERKEPDARAPKVSTKPGAPSLALTGPGSGPGDPGPGSGVGEGTSAVLAQIRARIERAKRYPLLLRKSGVQGVAHVSFRIGPQGEPEAVSLKSSSGSPALDQEALATIKRAAPFPLYGDALNIGIRFELKDAR